MKRGRSRTDRGVAGGNGAFGGDGATEQRRARVFTLGHHAGNEGAALGSGVHAAPAVPRIDQFHRTLHQVVPFLRHAPVALVEHGEPFVQAHLNVEEVFIGEGANPSGVDTGRNESHRANLTTRSALRWNRDIGRALSAGQYCAG